MQKYRNSNKCANDLLNSESDIEKYCIPVESVY